MSTLSLPIRHLLSETALSEAAFRFQEAHLATLRRIRASQDALAASWALLERSTPRYLIGLGEFRAVGAEDREEPG